VGNEFAPGKRHRLVKSSSPRCPSAIWLISAVADAGLVLTPDEKRVFGQLFKIADKDNLGVVTGEVAVDFFKRSGLSPQVLGEVAINNCVKRFMLTIYLLDLESG
jgi:hypothetical protein